MGAGISAAACCGSASSSLLLATLGLGSSVVMAVERFAAPLEWLGIGLLTGSTLYFHGKVRQERRMSRRPDA
ncbi:MAG: hypothetical protein HY727_16325 [Candidatus Rokubacteria bacterium]|nr:hypothetical protein [Candidatus Rokubacteria bacterium]